MSSIVNDVFHHSEDEVIPTRASIPKTFYNEEGEQPPKISQNTPNRASSIFHSSGLHDSNEDIQVHFSNSDTEESLESDSEDYIAI